MAEDAADWELVRFSGLEIQDARKEVLVQQIVVLELGCNEEFVVRVEVAESETGSGTAAVLARLWFRSDIVGGLRTLGLMKIELWNAT